MTEISPEAVNAQLERVLASPEFVSGERLRQFLRFVVQQSLNGHPSAIKQHTIAQEALGYGDDFDPSTNPTVRIVARRVRRALDRYYLDDGVADPVRIEIRKGSYIPVCFANPKVVETVEPKTTRSPTATELELEHSEPSVAVIALDNLNQDAAEYDYFAVGLTEEVTAALTRFSNLSVLGPIPKPGGATVDVAALGRESGALFALHGSVRTRGGGVRIMLALSDTKAHRRLWGQTFEYDLDKASLFEIEDEVTSQAVSVIADGVGIIFRKLYSETRHEHLKLNQVTQAVLKYNNAWLRHYPTDWLDALDAINLTLAEQPRNALMLAMKSNVYYADVMHALNLASESRSRMGDLALEAVAIDPTLQVARYNLVVQNAFHERVAECVEEAHRTYALNPNTARILAGCAVATSSVGEYELATKFVERAMRLNPHYPGWYHFIPYLIHYRNGQYQEAWREAQRIVMPAMIWHPLLRASVLGQLGRVDEAQDYVHTLRALKPAFESRPREYLKPLFVLDEHIDMMWDGLCKAGMEEVK